MADTWKLALNKLKEIGNGCLMQAFDNIDDDRSGTIDEMELANALSKAGLNISDADRKAMLAFADTDNDGSISKSEWSAMIQKA